jgi:DNA polymerase I
MDIVYLDIETDNKNGNGLNCFKSRAVTAQILESNGRKRIFKDPENLDEIKDLLEHSVVVIHNAIFDASWMDWQFGIKMRHLYDTRIAEIVISGGKLAGQRGSSLKDVVLRRCGVRMSKKEQTTFQWGVPLTKAQIRYAYQDLEYLPEIYRQQQEEIELLDLQEVIDIEMNAIPAMVWMYLSGINFDSEKLAALRVKVLERKTQAEAKLLRAFGSSKINFSSPVQLKKALATLGVTIEDASVDSIQDAKVKALKGNLIRTKSVRQTTLFDMGQDELDILDILEAITDYKESDKLLNTFIDKLPQFVNSKTGRVHASYNQLGAKSGRMSCSNPNVQQQPSKRLPEWRTIFTAPAGRKLVVADCSQAELRILAELSRDEHFINAYKNAEDLHRLTASKIYHKPLDEVTKTERQICKSVNFGLSYGMSATGLQRRLKTDSGIELTDDEAKATVRGFFLAYPGVATYLNDIAEMGLRNMNVRTKAGRLMLFDAPNPEDKEYESKIGSIQRLSKNLPIQGLCADFVKLALGNLVPRLEPMGVKLCAVVHDEIVLEADESIAEEVKCILEEEMGKAMRTYITCIPAYAEGVVSDHWQH